MVVTLLRLNAATPCHPLPPHAATGGANGQLLLVMLVSHFEAFTAPVRKLHNFCLNSCSNFAKVVGAFEHYLWCAFHHTEHLHKQYAPHGRWAAVLLKRQPLSSVSEQAFLGHSFLIVVC